MAANTRKVYALFLFAGAVWLLIGASRLVSREWTRGALSMGAGAIFIASGWGQRKASKLRN